MALSFTPSASVQYTFGRTYVTDDSTGTAVNVLAVEANGGEVEFREGDDPTPPPGPRVSQAAMAELQAQAALMAADDGSDGGRIASLKLNAPNTNVILSAGTSVGIGDLTDGTATLIGVRFDALAYAAGVCAAISGDVID